MSNYKEMIIRISKMKEALLVLLDLRKKYSLIDFQKDKILKGALERYLQLAAEASIDIGEIDENDLERKIDIAELDLESPIFNKDVFRILGEKKIISKKLANNFEKIARFRNILVHDYIKLDLKKMYDYLKNDLDDFDQFIKQIAKFLKKEYGY